MAETEKNTNPEEFILKLKTSKNEVIIEDFKLDNSILINSDIIQERAIIELRNCEIAGLEFYKVQFKGRIIFENCKIDNLKFIDSSINAFIASESHTFSGLAVKNCIVKHFSISKCEIGQYFYLGIVKSEINELNITDSDVYNEVFIEEVKINSLLISGLRVSHRLRIVYSTVSLTNISNSCADLLKLDRSTFLEIVNVYRFEGSLEIESSKLKSGVLINGRDIASVHLTDNTFEKFLKIGLSDQEEIEIPTKILIVACSFGEGLWIEKHGDETLDFYIHSIHIEFSELLKGILRISGFSVREIIITGTNPDASLILENVIVEGFFIQDFTNYGKLQLLHFCAEEDNSEGSVFLISNSYLGNAQFFEVDFSGFDFIDIRNSHLSEIVTSCVTWFKPEKLLESGSRHLAPLDDESEEGKKERAKLYSSKKEIFRQLKVAMTKHGSQADYLFFKQAEMDYYAEELDYAGGDLKDRFILLTNKTNDHGQNWIKPILLSIPVTVFFYLWIVVITSDKLSSVPSGNTQHIIITLQEFYDNGRLFFVLFNPARNLGDTLGESRITGFIEFLDLLHRILISYFIFQTVSAFRKFTKN